MSKFKLKIPATSANLGLGFDSIGIAFEKFLEVEAEHSSEFNVIHLNDSSLPTDEKNLIIKTAIDVASRFNKTLPYIEVQTNNHIPIARGLGSSSSAVVAGIELANHYCDLRLTDFEKIEIGADIEGHPDNIGPCITGGLFIGSYVDRKLNYYHFDYKNFAFILSIPSYEVKTSEARDVLPLNYSKKDVVDQSALSNVLVLALTNGDKERINQIIMHDRLHEMYRSHLIPEFLEVRELALREGAIGTVISGAGPTILTITEKENVSNVLDALNTNIMCHHEEVFVYNRDTI